MKKILVLLLCALALGGCAVLRLNSWDNEDSLALARDHAADILGSAWLEQASSERAPALMLGTLENRSGFNVSLPALEDALARELLLSGKVRLVRPKKDAHQPLDSLNTMPQGLTLLESGADALLRGWLEVVPDSKLLIFQLSLEIVDAETGKLLHKSVKACDKPMWLRLEPPA